MEGNLGRGVMKVSAVAVEHQVVEAPVRIFHDQASLAAAFKAGELERDLVAVVRFQGPRANGMPELHKLTPFLGVLQDRGFKVALVTDGRMSGASGKVPAAIHVSPEALAGGPLAKLRDGDVVRVDGTTGELRVLVDAAEWEARPLVETPAIDNLGMRPRAVRLHAQRHQPGGGGRLQLHGEPQRLALILWSQRPARRDCLSIARGVFGAGLCWHDSAPHPFTQLPGPSPQ